MTARASTARGGADLVLRGGPVITVDPRQPHATAVVVRDGRIVFVGGETEVDSFVDRNTRVVDLAGRALLPGFIDNHMHAFSGALVSSGLTLDGIPDAQALYGVLERYAVDKPEGTVIGRGWGVELFPQEGPRREQLDRIFRGRPVLLTSVDGHTGWASSAALELAGVGHKPAEVVPGFSYFEVDAATGEPTGTIREPEAINVVRRVIDPPDDGTAIEAFREWLPQASAAGLTAVFDAGVFILSTIEAPFEALTALESTGELTLRVQGCVPMTNPSDDLLPALRDLRDRLGTPLVRQPILKVFLDGMVETHTAAMVEPYTDMPSSTGTAMLSLERLTEIVIQADAENIDVHVHAVGDGAIRMFLDAVEAAAAANGPRDRRHAICHLQIVHPDDIPRWRECGVVCAAQLMWAMEDENYRSCLVPVLGERTQAIYPARTMIEHGVVLSLGTDWPASYGFTTFRPLDSLEIAVTRRPVGDRDAAPLAPAREALDLEQAIWAQTMGSAYQMRLEREVGSLTPGKLADLVVLGQNPFEVEAHEIHGIPVELTIVGGQVTHGVC